MPFSRVYSTGCIRLCLYQELLLEKQSWDCFWPWRCPQNSLPCSEMPLQGSPAAALVGANLQNSVPSITRE